jgi:hypothetical protein
MLRPKTRCLSLLALSLSFSCGDEASNGKDARVDLFPSRDTVPSYCTPASCPGCCINNLCQQGFSKSACGSSGLPCMACKANESCKAGSCVGCSPESCPNGCCDEALTCQKGTTKEACGSNGQRCESCSSLENCAEQRCSTPGEALYKITLVGGNMKDSTWSVCGFAEWSDCDLYVILSVGNATAESQIVEDTNSPTWNEYLLTAKESSLLSSFNVLVRDWDSIDYVTVDECDLKIDESILSKKDFTTPCGDHMELTFRFERL